MPPHGFVDSVPLRVEVLRLLTARYLAALLLKGNAGGTAGSVMNAFMRNNYLRDFTSHALRHVHSRVSVRVRASTADGLINEPDQAQGFT